MKKILLISIMLLALVAAAPASAHYLWMDPIGEQTVAPGETVTVDFYAHATYDDAIVFWVFDVGFDDALLDGYELEYVSWTRDSAFGPLSLAHPGYQAGASVKYPGESMYADVSGDVGLGNPAVPVAAGADQHLASIDFIFTGPPDAVPNWTGEDVWVEWTEYLAEAVYWKNTGAVTDIGTSGTDATPLGDNGPDYAAVPIPAAVWLLGSGLLGLIGIRRRN
jgi:hypothetical protein